MMKHFFTENLPLKVLSLLIALLLWLLVVNVSHPEVTDTKTVPLEVENQSAFAAQNKSWEIDRTSVTISYSVRTNSRSLISASDFHAYVDLKDYSITGAVPIYVDVLNDKDELIGDVTVRPTVTRVIIEDIQEKKFEIKNTVHGTPKSGYKVANVIVSPEYVYLSGPESEIGRVSSVGIDVNVEGIAQNEDGVAELIYYDANGNQLYDLKNVSASTSSIHYAVTLYKEKSINLLSSVRGTPAAGYQYESTAVSPATVKLAASTYIIDGMTVFELPKIDISGASETKTITFNLADYLPAGVMLAEDQDAEVNVTVRIEKIPETEETSTDSDETAATTALISGSQSAHTSESTAAEAKLPESSAQDGDTEPEVTGASHESGSTHEETLLSQSGH